MTRSDIEDLILRVAQGNRAAFQTLYDATSAKLFGIALRVLKDRTEAEEALQEVYVKIWHNAGRYEVNGLSPMTWLITLARNTAVDRLRKLRRSGDPADRRACGRSRHRAGGRDDCRLRAQPPCRLFRRTARRACRGGAPGLSGGRDLCRSRGAFRRAAQHDANLAAPQPDGLEGVSDAMSDQDQPERDDRVLAGEYTLGLLSADEAAAFEARLNREPDLRALYAEWAEDLSAMTDDIPPETPPARAWRGIEADLFGADAQVPWYRRVMLWGGGVAATAALILAIGFSGLFERAPLPPVDAPYAADLAAEDRSLVVQAIYDEATGRLFVERETGGAAPGRDLEMWLIAGEDAPVSLGVLPEDARAVLTVPDTLRDRVRRIGARDLGRAGWRLAHRRAHRRCSRGRAGPRYLTPKKS